DCHVTGVQTCALPICLGLDTTARTTLGLLVRSTDTFARSSRTYTAVLARTALASTGPLKTTSSVTRFRTGSKLLKPTRSSRNGEIGRASCRERWESRL